MKRIWMVNSDSVLLAGMNIAAQTLSAETVLFANPCTFLKELSVGIRPSAIVLDYHLSGVDLLDVLRVLRKHPIFRYIPCIVVVDARESDAIRNQLFAAGVAEVVRRDMPAKTFKALLKECLREASVSQLSRCVAEYAA